MNASDITFVIPVWDSYVQYLPKAIDTINSQCNDAQILVINNASTIPVASKAKNVTVILLATRKTLAETRNIGLIKVKTKFVSFLDADDEIIGNGYNKLLLLLTKDTGLAAASGSLIYRYPSGKTSPAVWPHRLPYILQYTPYLLGLYSFIYNPFPTCSGSILRTENIKKVQGFGETRYHEDWTLSIKLSWKYKIRLVKMPSTYYRFSSESRLHALNKRQLRHNYYEIRTYILNNYKLPRFAHIALLLIVKFKR